ncbi:MAG: Gldg family protein [Deltaproteobacteria bacterium]|nr:Gldg family protein [Deltaproteobacteria bacterium]
MTVAETTEPRIRLLAVALLLAAGPLAARAGQVAPAELSAPLTRLLERGGAELRISYTRQKEPATRLAPCLARIEAFIDALARAGADRGVRFERQAQGERFELAFAYRDRRQTLGLPDLVDWELDRQRGDVRYLPYDLEYRAAQAIWQVIAGREGRRIGLLAGPHMATGELRVALEKNYPIVPWEQGRALPAGLRALLLAGPEGLDRSARRSLAEYLARGGSVVLAGGRIRLDARGEKPMLRPVATGLDPWLAELGVRLERGLVMDESNSRLRRAAEPGELDALVAKLGARPEERPKRQPGGESGISLLTPCPAFVRLEDRDLAGHRATRGARCNVLPAVSPVHCTHTESLRCQTLIRSSQLACLREIGPRGCPVEQLSGARAGETDARSAHPLAVALEGRFPGAEQRTGRLIVVGASAWIDDRALTLLRAADPCVSTVVHSGRSFPLGNLRLLRAMLDWAVVDAELLAIRPRW